MPTSITKRQVRARQLHALVAAEPGHRLEDLHRHPRLQRWNRLARELAIHDLVEAGLIVDDAHGRIKVVVA